MQEQFLDAAISIGNSICRDAYRYNGQCNWVGTCNDADGDKPKPYYAALKGSWYNGTSGIAWFLAQLHSLTLDKCHRAVALGAAEHALNTTDKLQHGKLGFHSGLTGVAFSAIETGELLGQNALVEQGIQILQSLNQLPEPEYTLDVIDGCAGAIPALIRLNRRYNIPALDELLHKMGDFLLHRSQPERQGVSWNTMPHGSVANLTGYAHGAAGIAGALLELYKHTAEERYLEAALAGFAYEDSCFDTGQKNWPDFRENDAFPVPEGEPRPCGCAWCHGAPGIGLSRFRAYQITLDEAFKQSAQVALETTMEFFGLKELGNFSLCHGVFGNADLLLYASEVTGDQAPANKVVEIALEAIDQFERKKIPFPNGTQSSFFSPDLMLGLAGIGYSFLRLTDRTRFESVLLVC